MAKDIKYLDSVGLLTVLESLGLKFDDIENKLDPVINILFGKVNAEVGDVVLVNNETLEKIVVEADADWKLEPYANTHTPIGIVVIPTSHDVYGTGECGIISLLSASTSSPDNGQVSQAYIKYGQSKVETGLTNYDGSVSIGQRGEWWPATINKYNFYSYPQLPIHPSPVIDACPNPDPDADKQVGYYAANNLCLPSPYKADGSINKDYTLHENDGILNALSDFEGKENTEVLISLATAQEDWKTATTITDKGDAGYSPAACACWRYHTLGTNQGDWYLPAMGEMGYICTRQGVIRDVQNRIYRVFKISCTGFPYQSYAFNSSTSPNTTDKWSIVWNDGSVSTSNKTISHGVRPFTRMEFASNLPKNLLYEHLNEAREKFKDIERQIAASQSTKQVRNYSTKEELFTDIEKGIKFYHYDKVVVNNLEYTFYQDCNEVGEDRLNLFTALPLYPSLGGFTRVDVRDDNDEWPYFIQACCAKAKALGVSNQQYMLDIALVPRAAVIEPYYDNYYLHGYLTEPWEVPNAGDAGCLVWYWDIDINNEAAFAIYVVPSTRKISHLTKYEGSSPNLFKFYKEYTTKIASLIPTSARVQVTGTSTTNIMSQKAVTDELNKKADITWVNEKLQGFTPGEGGSAPNTSQSSVILAHTGDIDPEDGEWMGEADIRAFQVPVYFDQSVQYSDVTEDTILRVNASGALIIEDTLETILPTGMFKGPEELVIDCKLSCEAVLKSTGGPCKIFEGRLSILNSYIELFVVVINAGINAMCSGYVFYGASQDRLPDLSGRLNYYGERMTSLEGFAGGIHCVDDDYLNEILNEIFS